MFMQQGTELPTDCPAVSKARETRLGNDTVSREAFGESAEALQGCGACRTNSRKERVLQKKSLEVDTFWSIPTVTVDITIVLLHTIRHGRRGSERGEWSKAENTSTGLGTLLWPASLSCGTTKGWTLRLWHGVAVQEMAGRQPPDPFGRLLAPHQLHQGMAALEVLGCVCLLSAVLFGTLGTWRGTGGLVWCHAGWPRISPFPLWTSADARERM